MASIGSFRVPVRLDVGGTEYEIGNVEIDMITAPVPGDHFAVAVSASSDDVRPQLAALLRAAADHIEQGVDDAPADDRSGVAAG